MLYILAGIGALVVIYVLAVGMARIINKARSGTWDSTPGTTH